MIVIVAALGALVLLGAAPRPAAAGAWTTLLRPLNYTDLLGVGDTVWAASLEGGLLRYTASDGRFATLAREPGGLASNRLTALALDPRRRLWVGTQGAGVSVLDADRVSWSSLSEFDGLPADTVTVLRAQGDTMWVGTTRGIALWNGTLIAGTFPDAGNAPFRSNWITGIVRHGGDLWVSTLDGVYHSSLAGGLLSWSADSAGLPGTGLARRTNPVDFLASDGVTLVAVDNLTLYRWDAAASRWTAFTRLGEVRGVWDDGGVLVAASNFGVYRWDGVQWVQLTFDNVHSVFPRKRNLYVTALAGGRLAAANGERFCVQPDGPGPWPCTLPSGPPGPDVRELLVDGPRLFVATEDQGIGRLEGERWKYWFSQGRFAVSTDPETTFRSPAFPYGWLVDRVGAKWVGCWDTALERMDDSGPDPPRFDRIWKPDTTCRPVCNDTTSSHTFAWTAALDSAGGRWFGMDTPRIENLEPIGLEYYPGAHLRDRDSLRAARRNFSPYNTPAMAGAAIHALTVTRDQRVWVGYAGNGLQIVERPPAPGEPLSIVDVPGTRNHYVQGLVAGGDRVWALTTEKLYAYAPGGALLDSVLLLGQPSDRSHQPIDLGADGSVWVGSVNGLRRVRPDGGLEDFTIANSPLPDNEVRSVRVDRATGAVWIGTAAGLTRYDPSFVPPAPPPLDALRVRLYPNPARLTALGIRLRLAGNASAYAGTIVDLGGRVVHRFRAGADGSVVWSGHDAEGNRVRPGIYFVRVEAGGRVGTARVVLVR